MKLVLPLNLMSGTSQLAAGWAITLSCGSSLELLAIADTEIAAAIQAALGADQRLEDIDEGRFAGLVQADAAGLDGALQRAAAEEEFACRVIVRSGPVVQS
jgi:hypothetical protein